MTRPRTKHNMRLKNRRCPKCNALLNNQRKRCKRCAKSLTRPHKRGAGGSR